MRKKYVRTMLGISLALSMTVGSLTGCGQSPEAGGKQTEEQTAAAADNEAAKTASKAEAPDSDTAMGRFLESEAELPEKLGTIYDMRKLEDGTLRMAAANLEGQTGIWDSKDGGDAWEKQEQFSDSFLKEKEPNTMAIAPDGSVWASYVNVGEDENLFSESYLADPEGNSKKQEAALSGGSDWGDYISQAIFLNNSTVILQGLTKAYRYDCGSGSVTGEFPDMESTILGMVVADGRVILANNERVAVYDGETMEEQEISEGVAENILSAANTSSAAFSVGAGKAIVGISDESDDGGMYYLDGEGIFHQKWNGSVVEQLMDGGLSSLADPSIVPTSFVMVDSEHFLAAVTDSQGAKVLEYEWSKDTPAKPETELHIYSLYDNADVRQAAIQYQKDNPKVYVELEVGLNGEEGAGTEDVLKTLNTEIMAGNGPDLLLLDSMNVDSYIEKGILADLSDVLGDMSGYYSNIVNTYAKEDGSVPAVPLRFLIPVMYTTETGNFDYDTVSKTADVFKDADAKGLLLKFWNTCGGTVRKEDGTLDEEALRSFLERVKTMKGETTAEEGYYETTNYGGTGMSGGADSSIVGDLLDVMTNKEGTAVGTLGSAIDFQELISIKENLGAGEYRAMPGAQENVFVPSEIIGVNAKSGAADAAKEFISYLLSDTAQSISQGGGFPISKAAFKDTLTSLTDSAGISMATEDGDIWSLEFVVPGQEDIDAFAALAEQLVTPASVELVLKETILEQGLSYLNGEQDIDTTVSTIMQKMNLYLSE